MQEREIMIKSSDSNNNRDSNYIATPSIFFEDGHLSVIFIYMYLIILTFKWLNNRILVNFENFVFYEKYYLEGQKDILLFDFPYKFAILMRGTIWSIKLNRIL